MSETPTISTPVAETVESTTPPPDASKEARRSAAIILEVLAGLRTPTEACEAIGCVLPTYYKLEARALDGLVEALEPRPRGRKKTPAVQIADLEREVKRLEQELARSQSLLRVSYRSFGLPASRATGKKERKTDLPKGKRKRRPRVRATRAIEELAPESTTAQKLAARRAARKATGKRRRRKPAETES